MDLYDLMAALQVKLDAQSASLEPSLQDKLQAQSDSVHHSLQQHMIAVDAKFANLHGEVRNSLPSTFPSPVVSPSTPGATSGVALGPLPPTPRSLKLDVPRFDGSDSADWLFWIEAFFDYHATPKDARLQIVAFNLEGRAAAWFQWARRNGLIITWKSFLVTVHHRFGPLAHEDAEGCLSKLTHTGFVADFQTQFESLLNKVTGISEPLSVFLSLVSNMPFVPSSSFICRPP